VGKATANKEKLVTASFKVIWRDVLKFLYIFWGANSSLSSLPHSDLYRCTRVNIFLLHVLHLGKTETAWCSGEGMGLGNTVYHLAIAKWWLEVRREVLQGMTCQNPLAGGWLNKASSAVYLHAHRCWYVFTHVRAHTHSKHSRRRLTTMLTGPSRDDRMELRWRCRMSGTIFTPILFYIKLTELAFGNHTQGERDESKEKGGHLMRWSWDEGSQRTPRAPIWTWIRLLACSLCDLGLVTESWCS
jgi:hypothetical protein